MRALSSIRTFKYVSSAYGYGVYIARIKAMHSRSVVELFFRMIEHPAPVADRSPLAKVPVIFLLKKDSSQIYTGMQRYQ